MKPISLSEYSHSHQFQPDSSVAERRTRLVIAITVAMMILEIAAGRLFHSMALLADGWHMGTHAAAFLIAAMAYSLSRRHAANPSYSFGTGKMGVLGGFASAVVLAVVALLMAAESVRSLFSPQPIRFLEAILVAAIGLAVNLGCALLLKEEHHHAHGHSHHHGPDGHAHGGRHSQDLNRRAAFLHVVADAFTSVTAIAALLAGYFLDWWWMDPVMGGVGSAVIAWWAYGLIRATAGILLDRTPADTDLPDELRRAVEEPGDAEICDLHVWQVSEGKFSAIVAIVADRPKPVEYYRALFAGHEELVHVTIETVRRREPSGAPAGEPLPAPR